jgi:hypothetical protein
VVVVPLPDGFAESEAESCHRLSPVSVQVADVSFAPLHMWAVFQGVCKHVRTRNVMLKGGKKRLLALHVANTAVPLLTFASLFHSFALNLPHDISDDRCLSKTTW